MGDVITIPPPPDAEDELPLPCPDCGNMSFFFWRTGEVSCAACGYCWDEEE